MTVNSRTFEHVLEIIFENQYRGYVMENRYFRRLADQGLVLANCFGVMHPSQTNYIASVAGELCNVSGDDRPDPLLPQRTIVDLLEESGLGWKAYMDGYCPDANRWSPSLVPADEYPYVIKHNPFSSFSRIVENEDRWSRVVNEAQLWTDLQNGELPEYAWFTPDMWNDGHFIRGTQKEPEARAPLLVDQAAEWLEWFFGTLRFPGADSLLPPRTLVIVTFDEADFESVWDAGKKYTYDGPNQVYTVLLGDVVTPGVEDEGYNHYSVLRTVEENFGLGNLGKNDADSNWFRFLWHRRFEWAVPVETPIAGARGIAAAALDGTVHLVFEGADGQLRYRTWDTAVWSEEGGVGVEVRGPWALAAHDAELFLAYSTEDAVNLVTYRPDSRWDEAPKVLAAERATALALAPCNRGADLMLAYAVAEGAICSRRLRGRKWDEVVATGHATDGGVALCSLGHGLLLVFKSGGAPALTAVSYTTADFNVVTVPEGQWAGRYDDAVSDAWSPTAFPVAFFAATPDEVTPDEDEPLLQPYETNGPAAMAALEGVIHLVHPDVEGRRLWTETFSIAGVLTPKLPVSYCASDDRSTSNGYGTLAEAGWSRQKPVPAGKSGCTALALAQLPTQLALFVQGEPGEPVLAVLGGYRSWP